MKPPASGNHGAGGCSVAKAEIESPSIAGTYIIGLFDILGQTHKLRDLPSFLAPPTRNPRTRRPVPDVVTCLGLRVHARFHIEIQKLSRYAADKLTPENEPTKVLALLDNPMTDQGRRLRSIERSLAADRQYLARLTREPFVARLKVEWETEEGTCETLYITRASAAGIGEAIQDARVVSYRSRLGRLAEFAAGEGDELDIAGKRRRVRVRERLQLRPKLIEGEWDGLDDRFEFEDWSAELDSIRALLSELEGIAPSDEAIPDLLGQLLDKDAETTRWRDARRRRVVQRIALRDQPILDHYQGEVFRLPINSTLVLL